MSGDVRGRAALLSLRRRRAIATRSIEIMQRKAYALGREQRRLRQHVDETRHAWESASHDADRWYLRATMLGGAQQFELIRSLITPANAHIGWRSTMGLTRPAHTAVDTTAPAATASLARSSALPPAVAAYRHAVGAALDHAAASRALTLVDDELARTRRRLRALEHRWLPELDRRMHEIERVLAEQERDDMVRTRWAAHSDERGGP
jgi:V/A-type H+-transporting ATPase subunit D